MKVEIKQFYGEVPHLAPRKLPPGYAQIARNCRLDTTNLRPMRSSLLVDRLTSEANSFSILGDTGGGAFEGFSGRVDVARGAIADDRYYITETGEVPKVQIGGFARYDLKVPGPGAGPTATRISALVVNSDTGLENPPSEIYRYAYSFVTLHGEESAPSPLSNFVVAQPESVVEIDDFATPTSGRAIGTIRIYRSLTDAAGFTALHFVADIPSTATSYSHDPSTTLINEEITTLDFKSPPNSMIGITAMQNGMMAAHAGNTVYFCEPYIPHTWPAKYDLTVDAEISGLVALGSSLLILTEAQPYIADGNSPDTMILQKMDINLPCVSAASIVDLGSSAVYASPFGLVQATVGGAQVISGNLFTYDEWAGMNPSTIRATQYDGRYVFNYQPLSGSREVVEIDLSGAEPFITRSDGDVQAWYYSVETGRTFLLDSSDRRNVYAYDPPPADAASSLPLTMKWRSGILQVEHHAMFGVCLVQAQQFDGRLISIVTRIYADGELIASSDRVGDPFRLPAVSAREWEIEIEGVAEVNSVTIAHGPAELMQ